MGRVRRRQLVQIMKLSVVITAVPKTRHVKMVNVVLKAFVVRKRYTVGPITIEAVQNRVNAMLITVQQKLVHRFACIRPAMEQQRVIPTVRVVSEQLSV